MANDENGNGYFYIPYAFRYVTVLSKLPDEVINEVVFKNKTIDQAVEQTATDYGMDEGEDWGGYGGMGSESPWGGVEIPDDPDAVDKAKYQTENPNAILTPWGPVLDPEVVDAIIDDSLGVEELLGLNDEDTAAVIAEADSIIDFNGDEMEEILNLANLEAMPENLDPIKVATGTSDEMMNTQSPDYELSFWDKLMRVKITEGAGDEEYPLLIEPYDEAIRLNPEEAWTYNNRGLAYASLDQYERAIQDYDEAIRLDPQHTSAYHNRDVARAKLEEQDATAEQDIDTETTPVTKTGGDYGVNIKAAAMQADIQFLDTLIDLPRDARMAQILEALQDGDLFPESVTHWLQSHQDWAYGSSLYALGQDVLSVVESYQATPASEAETDESIRADMEAAASRRTVAIGALNDNLQKVFYQRFGARPGAGRYEIRSQMDNIFADSLTLFHLFGGEENFTDSWLKNWQDYEAATEATASGVANTGPLEGAYNQFLDRYMADPYGTRSGPKFDAAVSEVGRLLNVYENKLLPEDYAIDDLPNVNIPGVTKEDMQLLPWVVGMFGEDRGNAARRNLAKLYRTGGSKSYYAQQIHSVMDEMWDYWSVMGMDEAEIFGRMTAPREKVSPLDIIGAGTEQELQVVGQTN